ncbi:MAG: peptidoglycan DD-metalloendopeptidase family protein [Thermoleophilia bacterium]|nr:peptidoglycan DD-metalloendopeptidase family protein [Thermoleophilia bacterium]
MTSPPPLIHRPTRRGRRAVRVGLVSLGVLGAAAALGVGQSAVKKKQRVDEKLQRAEARLGKVQRRERVLTSQVAVYNGRVRQVTVKLVPLQDRLSRLEAEQERLQTRLGELNTRLKIEKERLQKAEDELAQRRAALAERLRFIYDQGEVDPILVMLESGSIVDAVETDNELQRITDRDGNLVDITRRRADDVRRSRDRIRADRDEVERAEQRTEQAATEVKVVTTELEASKARLETVRRQRQDLLDSVQGDRREIEEETKDLRARSAALQAKIVQAQVGTTGQPSTVVRTPSSAGMIWPASGTLTSGFGWRWGRMHEGIDIAVPSGTPVAAAASGTVIYAGWQGGYGNIVIIDHGGGIATAYGHNTRVAVSSGQSVTQGQVIAYSGSTGHSTGPHIHFEVRVNGSAVDPMGYL